MQKPIGTYQIIPLRIMEEQALTLYKRIMAIVSQWLLNDATNTDAADAVGGNTLTHGNTTASVPGLFGTAISCGTNSYFRRTSNSDLNPSTNMTLKLWVNLNDTSDTQYLMKHDGGSSGYYMRFTSGDSTNLFCQDIFSGGTRNVSFARATIETGKRVLIGMTTIGTTTTSYYN